MRVISRHKHLCRFCGLFLACTALLFASMGVWASPSQRDLRQTVPSRTPTKRPDTATPVPMRPTATTGPPTVQSPEPTPTDRPKDKPSQATVTPRLTPTEATELTPTLNEPLGLTPTMVAQMTAEAAASAGFPESGADYRPVIVFLGAVLLITAAGLYSLYRRRIT